MMGEDQLKPQGVGRFGRLGGALLLAGVLLLAACQGGGADGGPISGSGSLEGREVALASELGGRIVTLTVDEGSVVSAGQVLVQLDDVQARAQVAEAQAALAAARANLARVQAGPRSQEVTVAEAQLQQAQAGLVGAEQELAHAREAINRPLELDLQIAQAQTRVQLAEQRLEDTRADLDAEKLEYHIYVEMRPEIDDDNRRSWDLRMAAAQKAVEQAAADLEAAQADLKGLQGLRANPLQARAALHAAQAGYSATAATVQVAQARLDDLKGGARPEEVKIARAQVAQAQAAVSLAQVQREMLTITAPISGVVASRNFHVGETAPAGLPLLTLADLETAYLTIYVPQARIGEVQVGQAAEVTVDAYPEVRFPGTVERIGTQVEFTPRSVQTADDRARLVFAVRIRIPNPDRRLRSGMPAEARLLP